MPTIVTRRAMPAVVNESLPVPPQFPTIPEEIKKRFPSAVEWEENVNLWWSKTKTALTDMNQGNSTVINQINGVARSVSAVGGGFNAAVEQERLARIAGDEALAQDIVTVTAGYQAADTALQSNITNEQTARVTADEALATSISTVTTNYQAADSTLQANITSEATARSDADAALATSITTVTANYQTADSNLQSNITAEATARATADGYLSGQYTLTVAAGNVVTGMNITSSTGPSGGTVSSVTFQTDKFLIYNGTTGTQMFTVSSGAVKLGNTFTVNTASNKIHIGVGNYGNADTPFYADTNGYFSLGNKFSYDAGTGTLTVTGNGTFTGTVFASAGSFTGAVTATSGSFTGAVTATSGSFTGTVNASSGSFTGAVNATSGSFTGSINATSGSFTGTINSTSGTIGGFTLSASGLTVGSGNQQVTIDSSTRALQVGSVGGGNILMHADASSPYILARNNGSSLLRIAMSGAGGVLSVYQLLGSATIILHGDTGVVNCSQVSCTTQVNVNGTKVVGVQQAALANVVPSGNWVSDQGNVTGTINGILARLRTHGLIAP